MGRYLFRKKIPAYTYFFIIVFLFLFLLDYFGFLESFDKNIYDLFFRLKGARQTDGRIIIAAIDEKTLEQFGRWPFSRDYYALLLDKTQQADIAGFDIILTEPSDADAKFASAIKKHGRVILPVYFNYRMELTKPHSSFSPLQTGHLHSEPGTDGIVRKIHHTLHAGNTVVPSFSSVVYKNFTGELYAGDNTPRIVSEANEKNAVSQSDNLLINYYGPPATFTYIPMADIVNGEYPESFFKGKIVLSGFTAPGVVDRVLTPVSQHRNMMPGIEVHANALNNLLDKSYIKEAGERLRYPVIILFSLLSFILFLKTGEKASLLLCMAELVLIAVCSFLLFTRIHYWFAPAFLYLSALCVFAVTYFHRLDNAARRLDEKYSAIVSLPEMGKMQTPEGAAIRGLLSFLSAEGINSRIQKLLSVQENYEKKLQSIIDENFQMPLKW